jgi:hypothetical protein
MKKLNALIRKFEILPDGTLHHNKDVLELIKSIRDHIETKKAKKLEKYKRKTALQMRTITEQSKQNVLDFIETPEFKQMMNSLFVTKISESFGNNGYNKQLNLVIKTACKGNYSYGIDKILALLNESYKKFQHEN